MNLGTKIWACLLCDLMHTKSYLSWLAFISYLFDEATLVIDLKMLCTIVNNESKSEQLSGNSTRLSSNFCRDSQAVLSKFEEIKYLRVRNDPLGH